MNDLEMNLLLDNKGLRRIPIGEKENLFKYLTQFSANELKLYLVLQEVSNWNSEEKEEHRYVDYTDYPLKNLYKKAEMSEKTGIKCLKALEKAGWIELVQYETLFEGKRKLIKLPNTIGSIFVKCNLNLDLYRILKGACKPVAVKVYLYHCFLGSKHAKDDYTYKESLKNIARAIGTSPTNLKPIIDSNDLLKTIGVIEINKVWTNIENSNAHCENVYRFNHEFRTKGQIQKEEQLKQMREKKVG